MGIKIKDLDDLVSLSSPANTEIPLTFNDKTYKAQVQDIVNLVEKTVNVNYSTTINQPVTAIEFTGSGVTVSAVNARRVSVDIPGGSGGTVGGTTTGMTGLQVQRESTNIGACTALNFVGGFNVGIGTTNTINISSTVQIPVSTYNGASYTYKLSAASLAYDSNYFTVNAAANVAKISLNTTAFSGITGVEVKSNGVTQVTASSLDFSSPLQISSTGSAATVSLNVDSAFFPLKERVKIDPNAPQADNVIDILNESIHIYNTDATAAYNFNVRGSNTVTFNDAVDIGRCTTVSVIVKNGATAFNLNTFSIDGTTQTVLWQFGPGGVPAINADCTTVFTFFIIKTNTNVYTVLASSVKFSN